MLGGVVLAIVVGFVYLRRKKMPFLRTSDTIIPSVALGIFLTRIGCFFNGCCHGIESNVPWAVTFSDPHCAVVYNMLNKPLHPAQLYSSFYGLFIFIVLLIVERYKKFDGMLFFLFLICYGLSRFLVDFVRYYDNYFGNFFGVDITVNQVISLGMVLVGMVFLVINYTKLKKLKQ